MTVIRILVFVRARGAIDPRLFVAYFFVMFPTEVSSFFPATARLVFLHNMDKISITRRNEMWLIRRGGQSTDIIFRGNIDGIWDQIWGIASSFMRERSIINGNGR